MEVAPRMEERGVRMSWETARSRLARILSLLTSYISRCWCLTCVVRVLMMTETSSITVKVRG